MANHKKNTKRANGAESWHVKLPRELSVKLRRVAREESRSLNNTVVVVLTRALATRV